MTTVSLQCPKCSRRMVVSADDLVATLDAGPPGSRLFALTCPSPCGQLIELPPLIAAAVERIRRRKPQQPDAHRTVVDMRDQIVLASNRLEALHAKGLLSTEDARWLEVHLVAAISLANAFDEAACSAARKEVV
jgi:hypothetical protein